MKKSNTLTKIFIMMLIVGLLVVSLVSCDNQKTEQVSDGKSAYELAVEMGYKGTLEEWLASLVGVAGTSGKSAYEIALENGFEGSESDWLASLVGLNGKDGVNGTDGTNGKDGKDGSNGKNGVNGKNGKDGKTPYIKDGYWWIGDVNTNVKAEGVDGTDGTNGKDGIDGKDGKSAYEIALENGFEGTESEWLASLVGKDGTATSKGEDGKTPYIKDGYWWIGDVNTNVKAEGVDGTDGVDGKDGKSAYEIALENGFEGTESEWLASLVGKDGAAASKGEDGKSAYEIALENGFEGSESEWLASLVGTDGKDGKDGLNGKDGANGKDGLNGKDGVNGKDGLGIKNAYVNDELRLILVLTDGSIIDAGYVVKTCYNCGLPLDWCTCCPYCGNTEDECTCCPNCGRPLDECVCCPNCGLPFYWCTCCPDCGNTEDECICDLEWYTPFTVPSTSVVYGETVDTLTFNDVSGLWEVVTEEGEDYGAAYTVTGYAIAVVDKIDFRNASKITISADIKIPTGSNTDCGFILDLWMNEEDSIFQWEGENISYMFMYMNGANTIMSKIGEVSIGDDAGWGAFESWWENSASYNVVYTDYAPVLEFQNDEYINFKVEYDCEYEVYTIYYNGIAVESADFDARIFANEGNNGVGLRTNGANIYFKNINIVVE